MSSVGFTPPAPEPVNELQELRDAYKHLHDLLENLEVAEGALKILNFGIAAQYVTAAKWHAGEAQKAIEKIGQTKPEAKLKPKENKAFQNTRRVRDHSR